MKLQEKLNNIKKQIEAAKHKIIEFKKILVVGHLDADGISSAAIAVKTFQSLGAKVEFLIIKQLDSTKIKAIEKYKCDLIVFVDLGSGQLDILGDFLQNNKIIVLDHHRPVDIIHKNLILHLNAHLFGFDGSVEISGSGMTYLFAKYFLEEDINLEKQIQKLAVIGMMGDMQLKNGAVGLNKIILDWAKKNNVVTIKKDICYFGKQTRPVYKLLEYATEPIIPTISFNAENSKVFVSQIISQRDKDNFWKRWIDLNETETQNITTNIIKLFLKYNNGSSGFKIRQLFCDTYQFTDEAIGTEYRDVMEFATVLNACGRHNKWKQGVELLLGTCDNLFEISTILENHRRSLANSIEIIKKEKIKKMKNFQIFFAFDKIKSTIIGTVAGMALSARILDPNMPVIAVSNDEDDANYFKISSRGTKLMVHNGLKLNYAMNLSKNFNGEGGGHDIAAGCRLPKNEIDNFLIAVEECISKQLNK